MQETFVTHTFLEPCSSSEPHLWSLWVPESKPRVSHTWDNTFKPDRHLNSYPKTPLSLVVVAMTRCHAVWMWGWHGAACMSHIADCSVCTLRHGDGWGLHCFSVVLAHVPVLHFLAVVHIYLLAIVLLETVMPGLTDSSRIMSFKQSCQSCTWCLGSARDLKTALGQLWEGQQITPPCG